MAFGGEYHKINSVYKRDLEGDKSFIVGEYAQPEFKTLKDIDWICTEKINGMNVRVLWDGNNVEFRGKTDQAELNPELLANLASSFKPDDLKMFFDNKEVCFYGEGYGKKIQEPIGSQYNSHSPGFILFDIRVGPYWLDYPSKLNFARAFGIDIVPIVFRGRLLDAIAYAMGGFKSILGEKPQAEGLIAVPELDLRCRNGRRIITKIKTRDFV
jgi:hypothetical protein